MPNKIFWVLITIPLNYYLNYLLTINLIVLLFCFGESPYLSVRVFLIAVWVISIPVISLPSPALTVASIVSSSFILFCFLLLCASKFGLDSVLFQGFYLYCAYLVIGPLLVIKFTFGTKKKKRKTNENDLKTLSFNQNDKKMCCKWIVPGVTF